MARETRAAEMIRRVLPGADGSVRVVAGQAVDGGARHLEAAAPHQAIPLVAGPGPFPRRGRRRKGSGGRSGAAGRNAGKAAVRPARPRPRSRIAEVARQADVHPGAGDQLSGVDDRCVPIRDCIRRVSPEVHVSFAGSVAALAVDVAGARDGGGTAIGPGLDERRRVTGPSPGGGRAGRATHAAGCERPGRLIVTRAAGVAADVRRLRLPLSDHASGGPATGVRMPGEERREGERHGDPGGRDQQTSREHPGPPLPCDGHRRRPARRGDEVTARSMLSSQWIRDLLLLTRTRRAMFRGRIAQRRGYEWCRKGCGGLY